MKIKQISERVYNQDQSWYYERTVSVGSHKLKIDIRRNAYDNQSYGRVHRWDGTKWQLVVEAPITELNCSVISYVDKGIIAGNFGRDGDKLLQEAIEIVGA